MAQQTLGHFSFKKRGAVSDGAPREQYRLSALATNCSYSHPSDTSHAQVLDRYSERRSTPLVPFRLQTFSPLPFPLSRRVSVDALKPSRRLLACLSSPSACETKASSRFRLYINAQFLSTGADCLGRLWNFNRNASCISGRYR